MSSVPWLRQPLRLCDRMAFNQQSVSASRFFPPEVCHAKYWPEPGVIVGTACATSKSSQKSLVGLRRGCWLLSPTTASAAPATKCRTQPAATRAAWTVRAPRSPTRGSQSAIVSISRHYPTMAAHHGENRSPRTATATLGAAGAWMLAAVATHRVFGTTSTLPPQGNKSQHIGAGLRVMCLFAGCERTCPKRRKGCRRT